MGKKSRKVSHLSPRKALAAAQRLLAEKPTEKRFDKARELSHWKAPEPTLSEIEAHFDHLNVAAEEFVLEHLERLDMAGIPKEEIAEILGVHGSTAYHWRKMLERRKQEQRNRLPPIDVPDIASEVLNTYETMKKIGYQMIYKENASAKSEREGIRIIMRAQDAIIEYQKLLGYYDDKSKLLPPRPDPEW